MTASQKYLSSALVIFIGLTLLWGVGSLPAQAATFSLTNETSKHFQLKATIAYLQAFIVALKEGELSAEPTMVVGLNGANVSVVGTVTRDPQPSRVEACGPIITGRIDWGDGHSEVLRGTGCSGDAHAFVFHHRYAEPGSYRIIVHDNQGRKQGHVVAIASSEAEAKEPVTISLNNRVVSMKGEIQLDDVLPNSCDELIIAGISWGDGTYKTVRTMCPSTKVDATHTYQEPGTYKVYIRDLDGDIFQAYLEVK